MKLKRRYTERTDFWFKPHGYGHYCVYYTSPLTGKKWEAILTDMELVDSVRSEEYPKRKDMNMLKRAVKRLSVYRREYHP